jgi:hypothetical protein
MPWSELLRVLIAVPAGYVVMAVLVTLAGTAIASVFPPERATEPTFGYMVAVLCAGALAAIVAGVAAGVIAGRRAHLGVYGLVALIVLFGVVGAWLPGVREPLWYQLAVTVIAASGVWIGGYLNQLRTRSRQP